MSIRLSIYYQFTKFSLPGNKTTYYLLLCHAFNCSVNHKQAHAPILPGYIRTALYKSGTNVITNVRMWKHSLKSPTEKYSDK
ncbi:hypothetical protein TFUB4_02629 [Tannerella forsythia]|nr:hypothetical protein TFUB4_02629 [Tannerella forsythia]